MQIDLKLKDNFHMSAQNSQGNVLEMDASPSIGGQDKGFRPMETLLAGLAGCSSIDVLNILRKQRQEVRDLQVRVEADRDSEQIPSLFTAIRIHFTVFGDIPQDRVERAVKLSMDKYCSVAKILEKTAPITYDFQVKA